MGLKRYMKIAILASGFSVLLLCPNTNRWGLFTHFIICVGRAVILSLFCVRQSETSWENKWIMPDSVGRVGCRLMMEMVKVVQGLFAKIINRKS